MPLVSIIIPVYNAALYLKRTIESVMSQSMIDWELILVDDGSLDDSGAICDNYSRLDKRIHVIHKLNEGVSMARNEGIIHATGEWICFVDSDDWIEHNYLSSYFDIKNYRTCQLLMQSFYVDDSIRDTHRCVGLPDSFYESPHDVVRFLEDFPGVHNGYIWHRLFKTSIIKENRIAFPKGLSFAEDGMFFFTYMKYVQHSASTSAKAYHYTIRSGSLTSSGGRQKKEVYNMLLKTYIELLYEFPDAENIPEFRNFINRYACRLMAGWFVGNAYSRLDEKEYFIDTIVSIDKQYQIFKVRGITAPQRLMIYGLALPKGNIQDLLLKNAIFFDMIDMKIKRNLNKIKRALW